MGKLIVFEGTDGSGKSTQFELLAKRLEAEQTGFQRLRFPQYEEPSSALIRMYLGGAFGDDPEAVNAYAASTFYAVDRYASYQCVWKDTIRAAGLSCPTGTRRRTLYIRAAKYRKGSGRNFSAGSTTLSMTGWVCHGRIWWCCWICRWS